MYVAIKVEGEGMWVGERREGLGRSRKKGKRKRIR